MDKKGPLGLAFDIGTTTIAGASVDLSTGRALNSHAVANPQSAWGSDILSRVNALQKDPGLLPRMREALVSACNAVMDEVSFGRPIAHITAAGNSVMEHILLGVSPEPLAKVPYRPAFKEARTVLAGELGLRLNGGPASARLYTLPLIGGFVGGDAVSAALFLGLNKDRGTALMVDIGTNSEIMLVRAGVLYATSAAAGPAFEAGGLRYGMTARSGAIRGLKIEGEEIRLDVIGEGVPKGICGSGLVEAASELLAAGVIDDTGRIRNRAEVESNLANRVREETSGNSFVLYRGAGSEVTLSQADIRALQGAKAAIRAGISILLGKAAAAPEEVEKVYIAGAFGSNLKKEGLGRIRLLDGGWLDRVYTVGDAALDGAIECLDDSKKREAEGLAASAKYVSLSGSAHFEKEFLACMNF